MDSKDSKKQSGPSIESLLFQHNLESELEFALREIINGTAGGPFLQKLSVEDRAELLEKIFKIVEESFPRIMQELRQINNEAFEKFKEFEKAEKRHNRHLN